MVKLPGGHQRRRSGAPAIDSSLHRPPASSPRRRAQAGLGQAGSAVTVVGAATATGAGVDGGDTAGSARGRISSAARTSTPSDAPAKASQRGNPAGVLSTAVGIAKKAASLAMVVAADEPSPAC